MSQFTTRPSGNVLLYSLLGIFFGILSYTSLALSNTLLLYPLLLCFLYIRGGWIPVALSTIAYAGSFAVLLDVPSILLMSLLLVLPAIATIAVTARGLPYFTQLKTSVFSFCGGAVLLLLVMGALTDGQLVDMIVQVMDQAMRSLPGNLQDAVLTSMYPELADVEAKSIPILGNVVRGQYWDAFFREMRETLLNQLLPMLLQSALTTAFLCSYLTARSLSLRKQTPDGAFVPLSQWSLPAGVTVGVLLTTFAAYLIDSFSGSGSVSTFLSMFTIMKCVFAVQGVAAWDRMMCAAKASYRRKVLTAGGMAVIAPTFLTGIGLVSALFGRRGLLMKMKNMNPPD